ncbi:hypothetical protein [Marinoscillum pacificum]|uniref:hypothetical protein n=1 Tax=Marinoscillum pacificum TaxID=392723 RepID=UPI0021581225|nr:hypothetical protein [Marinoscillum pacificum]
MSRVILIISFIIVFGSVSLAQTGPLLNNLDQSAANLTDLLYNRYEEISGDPYLNKEFTKGKVITNLDKEFVDLSIRYNIYEGSLELKKDDNRIIALTNDFVKEFDLLNSDGKRVKFVNTKFKGHPLKFYQVLRPDGLMTLYKNYGVQLIKGGNTTQQTGYNASSKTPTDRFDKGSNYLIVFDSGETVSFEKLKRRDLENALKGYDKFQSFFDENKVKINTESDLINLLGRLEMLK